MTALSSSATPRTGAAALRTRALPLLAVLALAACGENEIVHELSEREANSILVVLESEDIAARKEKEEGRVVTWKIIVPAKSAADARRLLVDYELPKPKSMRLSDVFAESGMIPTQSEEKAKMLIGIQGEIEKKLKLIPGVLDVHAQVVIPNKEAVRDVDQAKPLPMASVVIVYNRINGKLPYNVDDIKKAVAASVEDMTPERVTVLSYLNQPFSNMIRQSTQSAATLGEDGECNCPPAGEGGAACPPTKKLIGVQIVNTKANATKFISLLAVMGGLLLLLFVLFVVMLLARIGLKRQLRKLLAENLSMKKARGGGGELNGG